MTSPQTPLEHLLRRPGLYFGSKSLTAFRHYYDGYSHACAQHRIDAHAFDLKLPDDLHDWVAYRTHHRESTSGWCNMILATTDFEEDAFDCFFQLLDDHAKRVPHLIAEIINPVSNCSRLINIQTREEAPVPAPAKVQLVKYNDHDPGFFVLYGSPEFRDRFYPCLSWFDDIKGGEWIIHDPAAHHTLLRKQVALDLKREQEREVWNRIRHPDPAYHQQLFRDLAREPTP